VGKNPAQQFYWGDWSRDLEEHPLEIEGAWIRICCKLWFSHTRGKVGLTMPQWAKLLGVREDKARVILEYISTFNIGTITNLTLSNGKPNAKPNAIIAVACRRMVRRERELSLARQRAKRFYESHKGSHSNGDSNGHSNGTIQKSNEIQTGPSSVSSVSSGTSKNIYRSKFKEIWKRYPNKIGKVIARERYESSVKSEKDWKDINKALDNYLEHLNLKENAWKKVQDGKTWFALKHWSGWVDYKQPGVKSKKETEADRIERAKARINFLRNEIKPGLTDQEIKDFLLTEKKVKSEQEADELLGRK